MVATEYEVTLTVAEMVDSLDNAREPTAHAATHKSGGTDAIKLNELAAPDNVTTLNATTARPGLLKTLSNVPTEYMSGTGEWSTPAGGSGTGIDYPGSSTVYLNGNGVFATPSASGSVFRPYTTIGPTGSGADYECAGDSGDAAIIQNALNTVSGGSKVYFLAGTYYFGTVSGSPAVTVSEKDIDIEGLGEVVFTGSAYPLITFAGDVVLTDQLMTADSAYDSTLKRDYITVSSGNAAYCRAGDIIRCQNSDAWPTDYSSYSTLKTGETYLIDSVTSPTLNLASFLIREYTTAKTSKVRIYRPSKINIKNITFKGGDSTAKLGGISLRYCKESSVVDCKFEDCGDYGIGLYTCVDTSVNGCTIRDGSRAGNGYGIAIMDGCADIRIIDNRIEYCRHCITGSTVDLFNEDHGIIISNNTFLTSGITDANIIDSHACVIDYTITGNTFYCHTDPSASRVICAFYDCCQHSSFTGNTVYNGIAVRRRDNINGGVRLISDNRIINGSIFRESSSNGASEGDSLTITNNICTDCPTEAPNGISLSNEYYTNVQISNNTISGSASTAILFKLDTVNTTSAVISGNNISNSSGHGILIQHPEATSELNIIISGNMMKTVTLSGIVLSATEGACVFGNSINGATTGIYDADGASYSNIVGNVLSGCTTAIGTLGAGTVSEHNMIVP